MPTTNKYTQYWNQGNTHVTKKARTSKRKSGFMYIIL